MKHPFWGCLGPNFGEQPPIIGWRVSMRVRRVVPQQYTPPLAFHRSQDRTPHKSTLLAQTGCLCVLSIAVIFTAGLQASLAVHPPRSTPEIRVQSPVGIYHKHPTQHLTQPCRLREKACPPRWGAVLSGRRMMTGVSFSNKYGVVYVRPHRTTPRTLLFWSCRLPGVASHQRSHPSIPYLPTHTQR